MKPPEYLTQEIAIKACRRFFGEKPFVFFGTGASCALDVRFGMPALRDALVDRMGKRSLTGTQREEWEAVISSLNSGSDLENALNAVSDCDLLRIVTHITGSFVGELDKEYGFRIADGSAKWPATQLIKKLVDTLSPSDPILHVLTPNYDLLFEYACDSARIRYTDGFFGGVERSKNWNAVTRALLENRHVVRARRRKNDYRPSKHVRLYKVHRTFRTSHHEYLVNF